MLGNWHSTDTTVGGVDAVTDTRTVNAANEYLTQQIGSAQQISLLSDDNGNLTDDGTQLYEYDAENRLIRVTRKGDGVVLQEYAYDALGRRVVTADIVEPSSPPVVTTHVYAGTAACIAEYDSTQSEGQTEKRWFVHGPSFPDPLVMVDLTGLGDEPAGATEYLHYLKDLLGSVTALANSNGEVVERYTYNPYGTTHITDANSSPLSASAFGNPFLWTSQRYDATVGLYHFKYSSYSPELGRWLQRDPLGHVDGASLYEYVAGNPVG
ncbi:MAG: RHS repeat-associated core domain-containing protein [Phycisphaerae bacterium]|nr:RHS repeat-associated core domain-containing protein [Phycisphaerae bacterium]